MLSRVEIDILQYLKAEGLVDQMNSRTIQNISKGVGLNYFRVRNNVSHLYQLKLIGMGFKQKQSNAFYITGKGQKNIPQIEGFGEW